jgi:hypothetical protein
VLFQQHNYGFSAPVDFAFEARLAVNPDKLAEAARMLLEEH